MFQSLVQLLAVLSLAYVVRCITVSFEDGRYANYAIDKMTKEDTIKLGGGQAFVRFATVEYIHGDFQFHPNTKVALKIANIDCEEELKEESKTYIEMKKRAHGNKLGGIPETEDGVGTSVDLISDPSLHLPEDQKGLQICHVIVIERWGTDLLHYAMQHQLTTEDLLEISRKINVVLDNINKIGVAHGDVKPQNVLLNSQNNPKGAIGLTDFGMAVRGEHTSMVGGADIMYSSPAFMLTNRAATHLDDKFSGAISIIYLSSHFLPWERLHSQLMQALSQQYQSTAKVFYIKIVIMKAEFDCDNYGEYTEGNLPHKLRTELMTTIRTAKENDPQKLEIQEILVHLRKQVGAM